jgi:hypothetical protein
MSSGYVSTSTLCVTDGNGMHGWGLEVDEVSFTTGTNLKDGKGLQLRLPVEPGA